MSFSLPNPPKLFLCKKCKVYFYTFSTLEHPTHSKCKSHQTRLADNDEIETILTINKICQSRRETS